MQELEIADYVTLAAEGDELTREKLIRHYRPYIINVVGQICKRYVTWSDEEASLGLLAFNRAIDTYDKKERKSFLNYVYLLIKRDLIDFYRKETKMQHVPLVIPKKDGTGNVNVYDVEKSMDTYQQSMEEEDLVEEILELNEVLHQYDIAFEELERYSPKHRDTRYMLQQLVGEFLVYQDLVAEFKQKKQLPVTLFLKRTGYKRKTVERHRKYIVTLLVLKLHPEWNRLSEYVEGSARKWGKS
ncbi:MULTISPECIES: RNA polymerase sigma-I factor [unclassified Virgibacillus]|uniref:RNA polymerase sigma-I factor n=1 Tax=unclassified Virgibacillus TaxID=2620237 RepID=UPI0024DE7EC7|nr:RNA polymerase sigma-I factor [Virgibacillus sp. LDC-1]